MRIRVTAVVPLLVLIFALPAVTAFAQSVIPAPTPRPLPFRLRYGLQARDRARTTQGRRPSQSGTLTFDVDVDPRLTLVMNLTTFLSRVPLNSERVTGFGDLFLGFNGVIVERVKGERARPGVSVSYTAKLPTGSKSKNISTGRVDHEVTGTAVWTLNRNELRPTELEVTFGGSFAGRAGMSGFTGGPIGTLGINHRFGQTTAFGDPLLRYRFRSEVITLGRVETAPSEIYANNYLQWRAYKHLSFRTGLRTGITANSPRIGVFGTVILDGDLRKVFR